MVGSRYLKVMFVRSDGLTQSLTLNQGESVLVGRDLVCDCRLDGRKVSRRHMRLSFRPDGRVLLQDNTSHNGTYVGGVRVMEKVLEGGEIITVGEWEGKAELFAGTAKRTATSPGSMPAIAIAADSAMLDFSDETEASMARLPSPGGNNPTPPGMLSLSSSILVDDGAPSPFDSSTDPNLKRHPLAASQVPATQALPPPPGMSESAEAVRSPPELDTRIVDMSNVWQWDDSGMSSEVSSDHVRAAPMVENPIVKRLTATNAQLDFRGIQSLPTDNKLTIPGATAFNVDAVALQLVFQVTEALQTATSMDAFLTEMVEKLYQAARAKAVVVLLPNEAGDDLAPRIVKNRRSDESVQISRTIIDQAIQSRMAMATEDAAADARFASGESVLRFDLKAVLCVPLTRGNDVIGAVYLTRDLPFSNTERDLVAALAHLIAMGLERSKLREQIAREEQQRRTLERFHAPDVVRRLMMQDEQNRGHGLFLETMEATILFCDLSGFTRFCESNDPEAVGRLLNLYLGTMTEIVFSYGGTVDKYIGDAIMCIFGAPFAAHDDALRAVRCAVEMRSTFREMMDRGDAGELGKAMRVHMGVNTGPVVAGTVGSSLRMEYTALGDTVNIAARLEGVAQAGEIIIGESTAGLVKEHVPLEHRGQVNLKGRDRPVVIYQVPWEEDTTSVVPLFEGEGGRTEQDPKSSASQ